MSSNRMEFYLSVFAVVISFVALALSWWQLDIGRTHNRISVKPWIVITPYLEGPGGRNGIYVANHGLGPAILKSMNVSVAGKTFEGSESSRWADILREAGVDPLCFRHGWPIRDSVLKAGQKDVLLAPTRADNPACQLEAFVLQTKKNLEISIEYESFYGETFVAGGSTRINLEQFLK